MSSRQLLSFALISALVILGASQSSVGGTRPVSEADGTSTLSASSGACVPPSVAVDLYFSAVRADTFILGAPPDEDCEDVCRKFEKTCDDIAHNARVCNNNGGGKFASLLRTTCMTFDDKDDRRACRDDVNDSRDAVRDCVNEDRIHAGACCDYWETEACLKSCLGQTFEVKECFTGPGGLHGGTCWFQFFNQTF